MRGYQFHGEFVGDASGGGSVTIYHNGSTTSHTLTAKERLAVTDVFISTAAAAEVGLFADADSNGERICEGKYPANGGSVQQFKTPFLCQKATGLKVISDSQDNVYVFVMGYIVGS